MPVTFSAVREDDEYVYIYMLDEDAAIQYASVTLYSKECLMRKKRIAPTTTS